MRFLAGMLAILAGCCPRPSSAPPDELSGDTATVSFLETPPGFHVKCVSGCEGLSVEIGPEGEMLIRPIAQKLQVEFYMGAPGYQDRSMAAALVVGENRFRARLEPSGD